MTIQSSTRVVAPARQGDSFGIWEASDALAPEFRLIAACCRWPPSESRNAVVRAAAAAVANWNDFLWLVNRQRVAGLAHDALSSARIELPPATAQKLKAQAHHILQRNLRYAAETVRLQRALAAADIPVLALKGIALAQLAYGTLTTKDTRDIDLLVPQDRVDAALPILESAGYTLSDPAEYLSPAQRRAVIRYAREVRLVHSGKNFTVELQWRAANNPLLLKGIDAHSPAQSVSISEGMSVRTLARHELFSYLCVHGAQHAWSRLKWLADLNALVSPIGADITQLYRTAQSVGAGICAGQALLLCNRLFNMSLPAALAGEIADQRGLERLVMIAMRTMADKHAEADATRSFAGTARVVVAQFLLGKGPAYFAAQYRAEAVRTLDIVGFPLPPRLHFLYPLLRLPLWLWRRAVAALGRRGAA